MERVVYQNTSLLLCCVFYSFYMSYIYHTSQYFFSTCFHPTPHSDYFHACLKLIPSGPSGVWKFFHWTPPFSSTVALLTSSGKVYLPFRSRDQDFVPGFTSQTPSRTSGHTDFTLPLSLSLSSKDLPSPPAPCVVTRSHHPWLYPLGPHKTRFFIMLDC